VKGYNRLVEKYAIRKGKLFQHYKVYVFLIRINTRVNAAMSVLFDCLLVRKSAKTSETININIYVSYNCFILHIFEYFIFTYLSSSNHTNHNII